MEVEQDEQIDWDVSRRDLIKAAAGAGRRRGAGRPAAALGAHARRTPTLNMWWWGEQELPGLQAFVDSSVADYTEATRQADAAGHGRRHLAVPDRRRRRQRAGHPVSLERHLPHGERVARLSQGRSNGLVKPTSADKPRNPTLLSHFGGNTYRVGWYPLPMLWIYNKDLFEQAGLDPTSAARDLGRTARRLREAEGGRHRAARRRHPGRLLGRMVSSAMRWRRTSTRSARPSSSSSATRTSATRNTTSTGSRLEELKKRGFLNAGHVLARALSRHRPDRGRASSAMGQSIGTRLPADSKTTNGQIGVMVMPVFGKGKLAGKPILDVQGLGISSQCRGSEGGGGVPGISELARAAEGVLGRRPAGCPSNTAFDTCVITDETVQSMWEKLGARREHPQCHQPRCRASSTSRPLLPTGQQIVQGKMTGEQAGELAAQGRQGVAGLQSRHGRELQEVGEGPVAPDCSRAYGSGFDAPGPASHHPGCFRLHLRRMRRSPCMNRRPG